MRCLHAQIHIIKCHLKFFIEAFHQVKYTPFHHHTGCSHSTEVLRHDRTTDIAWFIAGYPGKNMACHTAKSNNHASMLNGLIRIIQFHTYHSDFWLLTDTKHLLNPVLCDQFYIVIEKQQIFPRSLLHGKVIDGRIIKLALPGQKLCFRITHCHVFVICKRLFIRTVILNHQNLIIVIRCFLCHRGKTCFQIIRVILIWNDDGHSRTTDHISVDSIDTEIMRNFRMCLHAFSCKMLIQSFCSCLIGIAFAFRICCR